MEKCILSHADDDMADLTSFAGTVEEAVRDTVKQTGIKENVIRDWCEDKLITTTGTRSIIHQEYDSTGGLSNEAVSVLVSKHLIREESRFGATWIELTHDRLIDPIKTSNKEWRVEQERLRYEQEKQRAEQEKQRAEQERKKKNLALKVVIPILTAIIVVSVIVILNPFNPHHAELQTALLGNGPWSVSVNPLTDMTYVSNSASHTVSVIDGKTNTVIANITVGIGPEGVCVNPLTNIIYVANLDKNTVSVIDGKTKTVIATIPVGYNPRGVSVNPLSNIAYVTNSGDNTVSVIDGKTNTVISTIPVGYNPRGVSVNPLTNIAYVANRDGHAVSVIDGKTNTLIPIK